MVCANAIFLGIIKFIITHFTTKALLYTNNTLDIFVIKYSNKIQSRKI